MNTAELYKKYEKYSEYYELCEEGRESLREAIKNICADHKLWTEAVEIKNKLTDLSRDFDSEIEFKDKSAQFMAFVYTLAIEFMEKFYEEKNISRDILIDTISDLTVWINRHREWNGEWGFAQPGWLNNHIRCRLFKLGRLQFEQRTISESESVKLNKDGCEVILNHGDKVLGVHIPRGGKMEESACLDSFEMAKEFFPKYFDYDFKAFTCSSWLFDPSFEKLLPPDSNILKFQKLFTVFPGGEGYWGLDYVFVNITRENIKDAPTDTYFRKKLVEHLLAGGKMHSGRGYRLV